MNPRTFFVIHTDGTKFGPADVLTLKAWIAENRVGPNTMLEDAQTHIQVPAFQVPELGFPPAPVYNAAAPSATPWPTGTPSTVYVPDTSGNPNLWWWSILCGLGGCLMVLILGPFAIFLGLTALQQGWAAWQQGDKVKAVPGMVLGAVAIVWRIYAWIPVG